MSSIFQSLKILSIALVLSMGVQYATAAWTGPTATAPGGNVSAPINVGATDQIKSGGFWASSLGADGGVRIGTTNTACTSAISGTLRYYSGNIQYCNGSVWGALSAATPAPTGSQEWVTPGGPYIFTVPAGVTSVTLSLAGGGGSGAGGDIGKGCCIASEITSTRGGGGGGAGQGVLNQTVVVAPGQQIQVRIGGGGVGVGVATAGKDGGSSSFGSVTGLGGSGGARSVGTNSSFYFVNSSVRSDGGSGLSGLSSSISQSVYGASNPGIGGIGGSGQTCPNDAAPGGNAGVYSAGGGGGGVGGLGGCEEPGNSGGGGNGSSGFVRVSW